MHRFLLTILVFTLTVVNISCYSESEGRSELWSVKRIVDGDTFVVHDGTKKGTKIRLIGVDTPESRRSRNKEIGYYGQEAKEFLSKLISDKNVKLEYDVGKYDRYKRTLAYVYLEDGTFINAELVKQGYAMVMTVPPNVKYADLFIKLQREARESNRGLWSKK